jgi:DNA-binding response OmpR family regulator
MLKTDKNMAQMPVIILSGRSDEATRNRCTQMGAHFVCKGPEALSEVKHLVVDLLALNQAAIAV